MLDLCFDILDLCFDFLDLCFDFPDQNRKCFSSVLDLRFDFFSQFWLFSIFSNQQKKISTRFDPVQIPFWFLDQKSTFFDIIERLLFVRPRIHMFRLSRQKIDNFSFLRLSRPTNFQKLKVCLVDPTKISFYFLDPKLTSFGFLDFLEQHLKNFVCSTFLDLCFDWGRPIFRLS